MFKKGKLRMRLFVSSIIIISIGLSALICFGISLNSQKALAKVMPRIIERSVFRSANGKTYLVLRFGVPIPGEDKVRITTMYGTAQTGQSSGSTGNACGDAVTSAAGVTVSSLLFDDGSGVLNSCFKSALIDTTDVPAFDPCGAGGDGILTFSTDDAVTVGGMTPIGTGTVDVPAASQSGAFIQNAIPFSDAYMFGILPPSLPTTQSVLCNSTPTDGFDLPAGKSVVFAWNTGLVGFDVGAAGFEIDTDGIGSPICNAGNPPNCQDGIIDSARIIETVPPPLTTTTTCPTTTTTILCQCPDIPTRCISGRVIKIGTGEPVIGKRVWLFSKRYQDTKFVSTDSNGCYSFINLRPGGYDVFVTGRRCRAIGGGKHQIVKIIKIYDYYVNNVNFECR